MLALLLLRAAAYEERFSSIRRRQKARQKYNAFEDISVNCESDFEFINQFRLDKATTLKLCRDLQIFTGLKASKVSVETKVLTALAFYATGSYQRIVGVSNNLSQTMVSKCIRQMTDALNEGSVVRGYSSGSRGLGARQTMTSAAATAPYSTDILFLINIIIQSKDKMVILHKVDPSPPSRAAMMVIEALGIPVVYKYVGLLQDQQLTPEFRKKNPQHTVPLLEDGDFVIWDSHAIAAYLVTVYAKDDSLYPKDPKKRALVDQRLHFDSGVLFPRLSNYVRPVLYLGNLDVPSQTINAIIEAYDLLEDILKSTTYEYLAGDELTIADICCISSVSSLHEVIPIDSSKYPRITEWVKLCSKEPFYQKMNVPGCKQLSDIVRSKFTENKK